MEQRPPHNTKSTKYRKKNDETGNLDDENIFINVQFIPTKYRTVFVPCNFFFQCDRKIQIFHVSLQPEYVCKQNFIINHLLKLCTY